MNWVGGRRARLRARVDRKRLPGVTFSSSGPLSNGPASYHQTTAESSDTMWRLAAAQRHPANARTNHGADDMDSGLQQGSDNVNVLLSRRLASVRRPPEENEEEAPEARRQGDARSRHKGKQARRENREAFPAPWDAQHSEPTSTFGSSHNRRHLRQDEDRSGPFFQRERARMERQPRVEHALRQERRGRYAADTDDDEAAEERPVVVRPVVGLCPPHGKRASALDTPPSVLTQAKFCTSSLGSGSNSPEDDMSHQAYITAAADGAAETTGALSAAVAAVAAATTTAATAPALPPQPASAPSVAFDGDDWMLFLSGGLLDDDTTTVPAAVLEEEPEELPPATAHSPEAPATTYDITYLTTAGAAGRSAVAASTSPSPAAAQPPSSAPPLAQVRDVAVNTSTQQSRTDVGTSPTVLPQPRTETTSARPPQRSPATVESEIAYLTLLVACARRGE